MIRDCTEGDFPDLLRMGLMMREESATRFPYIEPERVADSLMETVDQPDRLFAAFYEDPEPVGFITAVCGGWAFSSEKRAACDLFYIEPERRSFAAALALARAFDTWAQRVGAKTSIMGTTTGVEPEATALLFRRLGYTQVGSIHMKVAS